MNLIFERGNGQLFQGGLIDVGMASPHRIDVIVLCAEELMDLAEDKFLNQFTVILAPNDDSYEGITREQLSIAVKAGRQVADAFMKGKRILTSCAQGRNRSGLVNAIALRHITGMSGKEAKALIKSKRSRSLENPAFNTFIEKIPARKKAS